MPNPAYLKLMGIALSEYNTYSSEKKEKFQKAAQRRLAELSENPEAYTRFTEELAEPVTDTESEWETEEKEKQ